MTTRESHGLSMAERLHENYGWTPRQREVLGLIAAGRTNTEIAERLGLSLAGAKWHVSEVLSKLNAESREEAAEYWRRYNGLAPRFARIFRGVAPAAVLGWAGAAVGLVAVAVVVAIVACALRGNDDSPASSTATSLVTATVQPSATLQPAAAIPPWNWRGRAINDWLWVRVFGDIVYVSDGSQQDPSAPGNVIALDITTGNERWVFPTPSAPFPVTVAGTSAVFGTASGAVFGVDAATGKQLWHEDVPGLPFQVVTAGSSVVIGDSPPPALRPGDEFEDPSFAIDKGRLGGHVRAVDPATGKVLWQATVGNVTVFIVPTAKALLAVSASGNAENEAVMFDATGHEQWRAHVSAVTAPPALAGETAILGGSSLVKLDLASGRQLWNTPVGAGTVTGVAIRDDAVIAATTSGRIESHDLTTGTLVDQKETCLPEHGGGVFEQLDSSPFVLHCGSLLRLDVVAQHVSIPWERTPQGFFQSADFAHGEIFYSSTIGSFRPPSVGHSVPGAK